MNKKEDKALREKILKKVAESNDTDAMAKILTEYEKAHANEIQWAEILKIVAILAAAGISAANMLLTEIKSRNSIPRTLQLDFEIIERKSTQRTETV